MNGLLNLLKNQKNLKTFLLLISFVTLGACKTKSQVKKEKTITGIKVNIADNSQEIELLKDQILELKGKIGEYSYKDKSSIKTLEEKVIEIKNLLEELKTNINEEITQMKLDFDKAIKNVSTLKTKSTINDDLGKLSLEDRYKKAINFYKEAKYPSASEVFNSMLGSKSRWYDEISMFYIGAILFETNKYDESIVKLQDFINKYPKSKLVKKVLLIQAKSFLKLNMKKEAILSYKEIVNKFPNSSEAKKAKEMLKNL